MSFCFDWTPNHLRCAEHKEIDMPILGNNMHGATRLHPEMVQEQRREYTKDGLCCIGWAVKQMRDGARVRRAGWNGKGMWLVFVGHKGPKDRAYGGTIAVPGDWTGYAPFIAMYTADKLLVPWLCSQTDLLASDWELA